MTPTTNTPTKKVTRTVFDLGLFDDVKLVKTITLPNKPATLEEALAAVGNDKEKLLNVIFEGLCADAADVAYNDLAGFAQVNEDGEETPYSGTPVDEAKGKLINAAILSLAKMNGYEKSLPKAEKTKLKDEATAFLRENPKMLANIQNAK